jgi:hypothetical protein
MALIDDYNLTINKQVNFRDKLNTYVADYSDLPAGVRTLLKSRFATMVAEVKAELDAINAQVQALP